MDDSQKAQPQNVNIKTANFIDAIGSKWGMIASIFMVIFAIMGIFFRVNSVETQAMENKSDIKLLESRVNAVEGDIKAIRQGVDYLVQKNAN